MASEKNVKIILFQRATLCISVRHNGYECDEIHTEQCDHLEGGKHMKKHKKWWAVFLVLALCTGFVPGVYAQTVVKPVFPIEPGPMEPIMEMPFPDGPVTDGQDIVEPGVTPVMSRERALELSKNALQNYLNVDVDSRNFQLNTEYRRDWHLADRYVWQMNWNLSEPMEYASANVTLDAATGEILDLNQDSGKYGDPQRALLSLTRQEAQQKAEGFIENLLPGRLALMQLRESPEMHRAMMMGAGSQQYMFNYVRMINGAVYDTHYINIGIDGSSGDIKYYSQRWEDNPDLPATDGILGASGARSVFMDYMEAEMFYLPLRNEFMYEPMPKNFRLAYRINASFVNMINAKNGKLIDWSGREGELQFNEKDLTEAEKSAIALKAKTVVTRSGPMNQQEAEQLAIQLALDISGTKIEVQSINYIEGDQYWESVGRQSWNIDFRAVNDQNTDETVSERIDMPPHTNGRIMLNALTGELIAYNWWQYYDGPYTMESDGTEISWEEAYDKAIAAIEQFHPHRINEIRTLQRRLQPIEKMSIDKPGDYYFQFPRIINGIVFDENHLSVGVNANSGKITSYTDRWSDSLTLPQTEDAMSQEQALKSLLENFRLELAYFRYNQTQDYMNPDYQVKLVYRWMPKESTANYPFIDAVTGTLLDYSGRPAPERDAASFEAAIAGHWVERTARLLAQQGIIDTAAFSPNQAVTRMEAVKMMVKARGTDFYGAEGDMGGEKIRFVDVTEQDEDYRYIQWAVRFGFIDNLPEQFERDLPVSREEAAVLVARFMGYRKLAEATGIFTVDYSDAETISTDALGAVAINLGLGTISGGSGTFRPLDNTTMAEIAEMIYNAVAQQRR
jgi:hypothetical protein